jgi:elongation factor P
MKVQGNGLRPGLIIQHKDRLCVVVKTEHTKPGKGGAYMQAELKDIETGTKLNERFRATEMLDRVRLEESAYQFLYEDQAGYTFMDTETFEQITISADIMGDDAVFLESDIMVSVHTYEEKIIRVTLPDTVVLMVEEADAVVKGQTASSSYKPAKLENGVSIMVPPHIGTGTKVVVKTEDRTYVERAK